MLNRERFTELLEKYVLDTISPEERSEFLQMVASGKYDGRLLQQIETNLQANHINGTGLPPHRAADILHKILSSEKQNTLLIPALSAKIKTIRRALVAAVIAAIIFSAYFLINNKERNNPVANIALPTDLREKVNTSAEPLKIEMEEGSIITLQPGSAIRYPPHFLPAKREIFLEGEAFFEVSKNAGRPFFVYNKNIVTHVLGTSFNVRINKESQQVEVSVRSGKVEVYENAPLSKTAAGKNNGVILLPNQKVIYEQLTRQFIPSIVDVPLPLIDDFTDKKNSVKNFVFDETPLQTVLGSLEKSYGIEIVVEKESIYKCLFTGDVGSQDLYTRLDIICQAVQATYEVKGTKILIKGNGCN